MANVPPSLATAVRLIRWSVKKITAIFARERWHVVNGDLRDASNRGGCRWMSRSDFDLGVVINYRVT